MLHHHHVVEIPGFLIVNYHHHSFYLSTQCYTNLSNMDSLRLNSNISKKYAFFQHDLSIKKSIKNNNNTIISKSDGSNRIKSQLSVSSNSAFTHCFSHFLVTLFFSFYINDGLQGEYNFCMLSIVVSFSSFCCNFHNFFIQ
jgi:hypothetical protein